jgi:uncharacterized protein YcfL
MEEFMKNIIFVVLISFFVFGCATANTVQNNNSSEYTIENESMTIKVIDPTAMIAPSKNEQAMQEYNIRT